MAGLVATCVHSLGAIWLFDFPDGDWPEKTRVICEGETLQRIDYDARLHPIRLLTAKCDAVLVADYGKGAVDRMTITDCIEISQANGTCPVIVDPARGASWEKYSGVTAIKCNDQEFREAFPYPPDDFLIHASVVIRTDRSGCDVYDRCCGHNPMLLVTRTIESANPIGAGDQFLAALGLAKAAGASWLDACRIANVAAWVKVQKPRTEPCTMEELIDALEASRNETEIGTRTPQHC